MVARKLAEAYLGEDQLVQAESSARQALREYIDLFGEEHEATARGRQSLGSVLLAKGMKALAIEQLGLALRSDEQRHGLNSLATARMRRHYAAGLRANGDEEGALTEERAARAVLVKLLPPGHPLIQAR